MTSLTSALCAASAAVLIGQTVPPAPAPVAATLASLAPIVSVWYRGSPAGTPRAQDLEAIRAIGFRGVTWPSRETAGAADLYRLAASLNLHVTLRIEPEPLTAVSALAPGDAVDIDVHRTRPELFGAFAWRALAHGARVVSFDAGGKVGSGLEAKTIPTWASAAVAVSAQVGVESRLVEAWRPAGRVALDPPAPDALDLMLLSDSRSWVLVVTNTSRSRVSAVARLPAGVPGALWVNLLDGSLLSMIRQPSGPRWSLEVGGGVVRVYVVNK